jgi:hypothetical protein
MATSTDNTEGSLSEEQKQIIVGCLLGDGTMRIKTNALCEINHCYKQKELVDWIYFKFKKFVGTKPKIHLGNGKRIAYRFTTRSLPIFNEFYKSFYVSGKKVIPKSLILNPLTMAMWFMDDGSKSRSSIYLNTQQFSQEEQEFLQKSLIDQWGIETTLNKDKIYTRIRIRVSSVQKFVSLIKPHILKSFYYKLPK